jgi:hypothetical protein
MVDDCFRATQLAFFATNVCGNRLLNLSADGLHHFVPFLYFCAIVGIGLCLITVHWLEAKRLCLRQQIWSFSASLIDKVC